MTSTDDISPGHHETACQHSSDALRSLSSRFTADHERVNPTLDDVASLVSSQSYVSAAKRMGELRILEERHMSLEEEILSSIELATGPLDAATETRLAHEEIRNLLDRIGAALSQWDSTTFKTTLPQLKGILNSHWTFERDTLLPRLHQLFHDRGLREDYFHALSHN